MDIEVHDIHNELQLNITIIERDSANKNKYEVKSNQNSTISSDPLLFSTIYINRSRFKVNSRNCKKL